MPNAPKSLRDAAVKTLTEAGATVTTQVDLTASYSDPQQAASLDELLKTLAPPQYAPSAAGDVPARAAAILAAALVGNPTGSATGSPPGSAVASTSPKGAALSGEGEGTSKAGSTTTGSTATSKAGSKPTTTPSVKPTPGTTVTAASETVATADPTDPRYVDATSVEVLAGLAKAGFVKLDEQPAVFADMAVVVTAAAPAKAATPTSSPDTASLDLVAALPRAGSRTVVVGPAGSADADGVVAQLRGNDSLAKTVSSVDDADSATGRIAMVFALAGGDPATGQYGTGQGAQAGLPTTAVGASPVGSSVAGSGPPATDNP